MWCVFLKIEPPGIAFDYIRGGAERAIPEGPQMAYLQGGWGYAPQRNDPMGQKKNQTSFVFWASAEISMFVCCVEIMKLRFGSVDHLLAVDR